jgi:hypothetical protein
MGLQLVLPEKKQEFPEEYQKCINDPYYFYTNYFTVNGTPVKELHISKEDFYTFYYRDVIKIIGQVIDKAIKDRKEDATY